MLIVFLKTYTRLLLEPCKHTDLCRVIDEDKPLLITLILPQFHGSLYG